MLFICAQAQNISVTSFVLDESDLTANLQGTTVFDQNGGKCALVRVQTTQKGFAFDVGVLGIQKIDDNKAGEIWVYVPAGVKKMDIRHQQLGSCLDYEFPVSIQPGRTYRMTLATGKVHTIVEQDDGKTYFTLSVAPKNAIVTVDGEMRILDADGSLVLRLPRGEHKYSVQSPGYALENGSFTLGASKVSKQITLQSVLAKLSLTCATPGVSLYINDQLKASDTWTGDLLAGDYLVEARKEGYYSQKKSISLAEREQRTLQIPALTGRYGSLDVNYKPVNSEVYIDGKKVGTSPDLFRSILMGTHEVEIRKSGYASEKKSITVQEGQTATLSGALKEAFAPTPALTANTSPGTAAVPFTVNGVSFNMIKVDGGTFTMGATKEQGRDAYRDEEPAHQVTLSDYYIGETEVTQELWQAVMGFNPSNFSGTNLPVEWVSWEDCQEFIKKLNQLTGKNFSLPTEAQWEFAARGGNKSKGYKYSGSNTLGDVAWYTSNSSGSSHGVGTKAPNELGIYDMSGNVWEWCSDWYAFYSSSAVTNPAGPLSGSYRVFRGGSWNNDERYCRVSNRYDFTQTLRDYDLGLRLALSF